MSQKSRDIEVDLGESNTEYNLWMEHKIENQAVLPSTQAFVSLVGILNPNNVSQIEVLNVLRHYTRVV